MADLAEARRFYAEELKYTASLSSDALVEAFATVPRERFLDPGPWQLIGQARFGRKTTPDADPRHLYHDVLVPIDPERSLNNGSPSLWAVLLDELAPAAGERVFHLGAGTGYYSAIQAELVGPAGQVLAAELDPELAARARANLEPWPWAEVRAGDGTLVDPGPVDVIVVNAGVTHALPVWLERLRPGGRMLLPITGGGFPAGGFGGALRVRHTPKGLAARFVSRIGIYPCAGARDPERESKIAHAFADGGLASLTVHSLRTDDHAEQETCWLHTPGFCLSTLAVD